VNRLLICGILITVTGVALFIYSLAVHSEENALYNQINFDELDNNKQIPTSDKYYKYLSIADFLNQKLNQNKSLPIKNMSCVYLDYAYHNTVSLYKLIYNGDRSDTSRREVTESNVQNLFDMTGSYAGCKKSAEYKIELNKILEDIKKSNELYKSSDFAMDSFLRGDGQIQKREDFEAGQFSNSGDVILQDNYPTEDEQYIPMPDKTHVMPDYELSGSYQ